MFDIGIVSEIKILELPLNKDGQEFPIDLSNDVSEIAVPTSDELCKDSAKYIMLTYEWIIWKESGKSSNMMYG